MTRQGTKTIQMRRIIFLILGLGMAFPMLSQTEEGIGTYYADKYHGRSTASGEPYNKFNFTAAHRTLPFGTWVLVTNLTNNRSVRVRINDRGPFTKGRIIDLSRAAAEQIDMIRTGEVRVRMQIISGTANSPVAAGGGFSPAVSPRSRKSSNVDLSKLPVVDINGNPLNTNAEPVYSNSNETVYDGSNIEDAYVPEDEPVAYTPGMAEASKHTPSLFRMLAFRQEAIGYGVQVGAYFNFYKLLEGLDALSAKGFQQTIVQNGMKNNEPVFRIIVGPFATKPEADSMRRKLTNSKIKGITVDLANLR